MTQHMYNEDKIMIVHVHLKKRYQKQQKLWEKPSVEVAEWNERLSTYKLFHRISTQTPVSQILHTSDNTEVCKSQAMYISKHSWLKTKYKKIQEK